MPIAAKDPADRAEQIILLTERLLGLVRRESDALIARRPALLAQTAEEKARLSSLYAREMSAIRKSPALIEGAGAALLARLKSVTGEFRDALAEHDRLLTRLRQVSEGMIRAIAEEVGRTRRTVTGYGRDASMKAYARPGAASLTLNQTV